MRLSRECLSVFAVVAIFIGGTPPVKAAGEHDCCERSILKLAAERSAGAPVRSFGAGDLAHSSCRMDHSGIRGAPVAIAAPSPAPYTDILVAASSVVHAPARDIVAATGPPIYIVQLSLLV